MSVADNDILRIVASFLWTDGEINQNVFNCLISGGGGPYDDQDVADDAEDWLDNMYANFNTSMSDEIDGNETLVYKYDTVGEDWDEVTSNALTFNPVAAVDQLPRGVALLARLWTTDPDVQGRKFIPGLVETNVTDGLFTGAIITSALAFAADWYLPFVGAATGANFTPGIWSVVQKALLLGVDHIAVSSIPAYQRRRKNNVGI